MMLMAAALTERAGAAVEIEHRKGPEWVVRWAGGPDRDEMRELLEAEQKARPFEFGELRGRVFVYSRRTVRMEVVPEPERPADCPPWCTSCQQALMSGQELALRRAHHGRVGGTDTGRRYWVSVDLVWFQGDDPEVVLMDSVGPERNGVTGWAEVGDADSALSLAVMLERLDPSEQLRQLAAGLRDAAGLLNATKTEG